MISKLQGESTANAPLVMTRGTKCHDPLCVVECQISWGGLDELA